MRPPPGSVAPKLNGSFSDGGGGSETIWFTPFFASSVCAATRCGRPPRYTFCSTGVVRHACAKKGERVHRIFTRRPLPSARADHDIS